MPAATPPPEPSPVATYEAARRALGEAPGDVAGPQFQAAYLDYREAELALLLDVLANGEIQTPTHRYSVVRGRLRRDPRHRLFNPMGGCRRG